MAYSEFLVPISGAANDDIIVKRAAKLFESAKVPTSLLFLESDPNTVLGWSSDGMVAGFSANLVDSLSASQEQLWERVQNFTKDYKDFGLERAKGLGEGVLSERAALCDLMIVSAECARGESPLSMDFESALIGERVPVLVLHDCEDYNFKNCVIAWNGSAQSARALKAAIPFLQSARKVTIIQIDNNKENESLIFKPEIAQKYLVRNGINASCEVYDKCEKSTGADLIKHATRLGADLLISGAYGHSRAREFIFGGATKSFIKSQNGINLLISH